MGRILLRVCLGALSVIVAFASAEALVREIDGFAVRPLRLQRRFRPDDDDSALARKHAGRIPLTQGVELGWFDQSPNPVPVPPVDPELEQRYWIHPGTGLPAVYEWNTGFLRFASCQEPWKSTTFAKLTDVFAFESTDGGMFPTFRFLRGVHLGSGLNPNNFGWRGPDL